MLAPLLILLVILRLSVSDTNIADHILKKQEECKEIYQRVSSVALDEGGDKFPGLPIPLYYECKNDLDNLKHEYINTFFQGMSLGYNLFPAKLSNGTVIMMPTPPTVETTNTSDPPHCPSCEVLCMFYNRCAALSADIAELSDSTLIEYNKLHLAKCEVLLEEQKEKFFYKHNISHEFIADAQHISLVCKRGLVLIPLQSQDDDDFVNEKRSVKEGIGAIKVQILNTIENDKEGETSMVNDPALNTKLDRITSHGHFKDSKDGSDEYQDQTHFGEYDHGVLITATPMPDISGDELFDKESNCEDILRMANSVLDKRSFDSVRYYDVQYAECKDSLDEVKQVYAEKHGIALDDYKLVFPILLSSGVERLVTLPKKTFKSFHSAILPESPSPIKEASTQETLDDKPGRFIDEAENNIYSGHKPGIFITRTPMTNPAFISNEIFNAYHKKHSQLQEVSTLVRIANLIRKPSGRSERTVD